ncbi:MAG: hypothetical protein ACRD4P_05465 [Bryobacteraceae bacterium]
MLSGKEALEKVTAADAAISRLSPLVILSPLVYPLEIVALRWAARVTGPAAFWAETAMFVLTLSGPALAVAFLILLDGSERERREYRWTVFCAFLAFVSPALFTLLSNWTYIAGATAWTGVSWWVLLAALAIASFARFPARIGRDLNIRRAHGISALLLIAFVLAHLANHTTAIVSVTDHTVVLHALRRVYRNAFVEPILLTFFGFQIVTGSMLFWNAHRQRTNVLGVLQTLSGLFLGVFLLAHTTAVFVLGRHVMRVDTDFNFASGGPAGLFGSGYAHLAPYYFLAPVCLFVHLGCALRWNLIPRWSEARADRAAYATIGVGVAVSTVILLALCGVRIG